MNLDFNKNFLRQKFKNLKYNIAKEEKDLLDKNIKKKYFRSKRIFRVRYNISLLGEQNRNQYR